MKTIKFGKDIFKDLDKKGFSVEKTLTNSPYDVDLKPSECHHLIVNVSVACETLVYPLPKELKGKTILISECLNCNSIVDITVRSDTKNVKVATEKTVIGETKGNVDYLESEDLIVHAALTVENRIKIIKMYTKVIEG
jgi:hypothetical protein